MNRKVDLAAVAIMVPQLSAAPAIDAQSRLRITGVFPGQPVGISFDLLFEPVAGQWRLFGIAANTVAAAAPAVQGATGAPAAPSVPAAKTAPEATNKTSGAPQAK